jgi:3-mercaptopyruvate sulfurtransferase SseA
MKIELEVSELNESTASPWWVIVDPKQMMKPDPYYMMMGMITGPFFSRREATDFFTAKRHRFSDRAVVYCASGNDSCQYDQAYRKAETKHRQRLTAQAQKE